jgi:hypothetical protein
MLSSKGLLCLLLISCPSVVSAKPESFRFKPGPRSVTRSFAIAELGYALRLTGADKTPGDKGGTYVSDHGILFNVSERYAAGLVLHGEAEHKRSRLGPTIRIRRWLGAGSALDVEAGALLLGAESAGIDFRQPAPFLQLSLSAGDVLVVYAQAQAHAAHLRGGYPRIGGLPSTRMEEDVNDVVTDAGLKLGTVPGRAATVIVMVLAGITFYTLSRGGD